MTEDTETVAATSATGGVYECRGGGHVFPSPVRGGSPCACGSLRIEGEDVSGGCFVSAVVSDSPTGERVTVAVWEPAAGEGSA